MATYKKKLKTIIVHQMLDGATVTIEDTASDDKATRALNEFKAYETMHYETEVNGNKITNAIPYHAVQYIEVTEAEADITKADPYGCDEGGGDTYTVTFKAVEYGEVKDVLSPISVEKGKSIKLPNDYVGWYTHNEGESFDHCSQTAWTRVGNSGEDYTPTADVTLYAVEPCE